MNEAKISDLIDLGEEAFGSQPDDRVVQSARSLPVPNLQTFVQSGGAFGICDQNREEEAGGFIQALP